MKYVTNVIDTGAWKSPHSSYSVFKCPCSQSGVYQVNTVIERSFSKETTAGCCWC